MKSQILIALSVLLAAVSVHADLANYQSTVSGQSPAYYFNFDNSLSSVGNTATFTANGGATFGSDYFVNANDAALFPATSDYLSLANPPAVISGEGTATAVGSLSLLFYVPATIPTTGYYFSDSETTGGAANGQTANSAFAFQISSAAGALTLKVGNVSVTGLPTVTANTWYYLGLSYNLNGTATGVNGINWYLGQAGGSTLYWDLSRRAELEISVVPPLWAMGFHSSWAISKQRSQAALPPLLALPAVK